ncbi:TPA: hypothetical protein IGZ61_002258 [Escherichia coli]|nr:hypothetical protein [Escherichia coli]
MIRVILIFISLIISFNAFSRAIPPIETMKLNIGNMESIKKNDWKDGTENGQLTSSTMVKNDVSIALNREQLGVFIRVNIGGDREDGRAQLNRAMRRCQKLTASALGGLNEQQRNEVNDLIMASVKVIGYTVSDYVNEYELSSTLTRIDNNVIVQCGARSVHTGA